MSSLAKATKAAWAELGLPSPEIRPLKKAASWEKTTEEVFAELLATPTYVPTGTVRTGDQSWESELREVLEAIPEFDQVTKPTLQTMAPWEPEFETLWEEIRFKPESILDFEAPSTEKMPNWELILNIFWEECLQFEKELPFIPATYRALKRIRAQERKGEFPEWWENRLFELLKEIAKIKLQIPEKKELPPLKVKKWEGEIEELFSKIHKPISIPRRTTLDNESTWETFLWWHWCNYQKAQPATRKKSREEKWEKDLKKVFAVSYNFSLPTSKEIWLPPMAPKIPNPIPEDKPENKGAFKKLILFGERNKEARERDKSRLWPTSRRRKEQNKKERGEKRVGKGWMHLGRWLVHIEKTEQVTVTRNWSGRKMRRVDLINVPNYYWVQQRIRPAALPRWEARCEGFESRAGLQVSEMHRPRWLSEEDWLWKIESSREFTKLLAEESQNHVSLAGNPDLQKKFSK